MEVIWNRIENWLKVNAPEIQQDLLPGVTDKELRSVQQLIGSDLPADVKASYYIHNGQAGGTPLIGEWQLLPLKNIASEWNIMKRLHDRGKFDKAKSKPKGPVLAEWWNPKWIPFAYNGAGDFYCLDLNPAQGGEVGQIITFWHMLDTREVVANGFRTWLSKFADNLEHSKYRIHEGRLVISD